MLLGSQGRRAPTPTPPDGVGPWVFASDFLPRPLPPRLGANRWWPFCDGCPRATPLATEGPCSGAHIPTNPQRARGPGMTSKQTRGALDHTGSRAALASRSSLEATGDEGSTGTFFRCVLTSDGCRAPGPRAHPARPGHPAGTAAQRPDGFSPPVTTLGGPCRAVTVARLRLSALHCPLMIPPNTPSGSHPQLHRRSLRGTVACPASQVAGPGFEHESADPKPTLSKPLRQKTGTRTPQRRVPLIIS